MIKAKTLFEKRIFYTIDKKRKWKKNVFNDLVHLEQVQEPSREMRTFPI